MSIRYSNVSDILKKRKIKYPDFACFNSNGSVIKIIQWQPKGILSFEERRGFWCGELIHCEKAKQFIEEANNKKADIVITPEYSFPWNVIQGMIEDEKLYPKNGKLYCLGMEGISCDDLKGFVARNASKTNICVITENIDNLQENYFFSCLLYLFRTAGKIICLIQFKTTPASDKWAELEAKGLTRGNEIYLFKSMNAECYMLSYICADVLNQEIETFRAKVPYQECLILHPQLNPKPLHETFEQMRGNYLNYDAQKTRIIGINWAKDTILPAEGRRGEIRIEESVSACFYNGTWNRWEKENIKLLRRNKAKGIDLDIGAYSLTWYMPDDEHCMFYMIDCFSSRMLSNVTGVHKEPIGDTYYQFCNEESRWVPQLACCICRIDWKWLKTIFRIEKCIDGECNNSQLIHFFSILLAGLMIEEPELAQNRIYSIMNKEACDNTLLLAWREKCGFVDQALSNGILPKKFVELGNGNYKWILNEDGNLTTKEGARIYSVIYVNSSLNEIIEKSRNQFVKNMGGNSCDDRLIIYYLGINGIRCYEDFYNTEINRPEYTSPTNRIV